MKLFLSQLLILLYILTLSGQDLLPFKENGKIGYKDSNDSIKIPATYNFGSKFIYNKALVSIDLNLYGVINQNNTIMIPIQYEFLNNLDSTEYIYGVRSTYFGEYKMGVLDKIGNIKISNRYDYIIKSNGYIVQVNKDTIIGNEMGMDVRAVTSKYGFYTIDGNLILKPNYDYIKSISENLISVDSANYRALYTKQGEVIFPLQPHQSFYYGKENRVKFSINKKHGFLDISGKIIIPEIYDWAKNFQHGFSMVSLQNKCGTIDLNGNVLIPIENDCIKLYEKIMKEYPDIDYQKPEL